MTDAWHKKYRSTERRRKTNNRKPRNKEKDQGPMLGCHARIVLHNNYNHTEGHKQNSDAKLWARMQILDGEEVNTKWESTTAQEYCKPNQFLNGH